MGCDREYGGACTLFVVGVARHVEGLEERADIPYMDFARFAPSRDIIGLGNRWQGGRCREGLAPNAVNTAKMRDRSELDKRIFVQGIRIIFVIGIRFIWELKKWLNQC